MNSASWRAPLVDGSKQTEGRLRLLRRPEEVQRSPGLAAEGGEDGGGGGGSSRCRNSPCWVKSCFGL